MSRARRILVVLAGVAASVLAVHFVVAALVKPLPAHQFWNGNAPRVIAHRGGAGLWPENTLYAFQRAVALGVDVLEMDLRRSADGELVVLHDDTVDRTTDGSGQVQTLSVAQLKRLDAGHRWTPDGGVTHPYRGQGIAIPTLREVLVSLPSARLNLEIKRSQTSVGRQLCDLIRDHAMELRVAVASVDQQQMNGFRSACPNVATAATKDEVMRFVGLGRFFLTPLYEPRAAVFQVPERVGSFDILTPRFARNAQRLNMKVEVWTVNESQDMRRLLALPVDGIMTDYPDRLLRALGRS